MSTGIHAHRELQQGTAKPIESDRFRAVAAGIYDLLLVLECGPDGLVHVFASDSSARILGYSPAELTAGGPLSFVHPEERPGALATLSRCASLPGAGTRVEFRAIRKDGTECQLEARIINRLHDEAAGLIVTLHDISQIRRNEDHWRERAHWFQAVTARVPDALQVFDAHGVAKVTSRAAYDLFGASPPMTRDALIGLVHPSDRARVERSLTEAWNTPGDRRSLSYRFGKEEDGWRVIETEVTNRIADADVKSVILTSRDASRVRRYDGVTTLPNGAVLLERVRTLLERPPDERPSFAVLATDLDRFRTIGDHLGRIAADTILDVLGRRIMRCIRPGDLVARVGPDRFAVLLEQVEDHEAARHIAGRLRKAVEQPVHVEGHEVFTTLTVGAATNLQSLDTAEDILQAAYTALHLGKRHGGARVELFDGTPLQVHTRRIETGAALRRAIPQDELRIHYQPIIELKSKSIIGFEALVRWERPDHGLLAPAHFVPLAEEIGLISDLGRWVLLHATETVAGWPGEPRLAVNLSARQFDNVQLLVNQVKQALDQSHFPADRLDLEVTETALLRDPKAAARGLQAIRDLGVRIAMDDFGIGYSSLSQLQQYPFDLVKIDRTFVEPLNLPEGDHRIVPALVHLANALELDVVAEGIESPKALRTLQDMRCAYGQGFLFSRPVPPDEALKLLTS